MALPVNLSIRTPAAGFLLALLLAPCAKAGDWYVDPKTGDDATGDGSASAPWRTISHALTAVPGPSDRLLLAPGQYSERSGERFPLAVPASVSVTGAGRDATRIVGESGADVFRLSGAEGMAWQIDAALSHLTVRGGQSGIRLLTGDAPQVKVVDVAIEATAGTGLALFAASKGGATGPGGQFRFIGSTIAECPVGAVVSGGQGHHPSLLLEGSEVLDCGTGAIVQADAPDAGAAGSATLHLSRSRIADCGLGLIVSGAGGASANCYAVDSYVVDCLRAVDAVDRANVNLSNCTVAGTGVGLSAVGPNPDLTWFWIGNSILWCDPATTLPAAGNLFAHHTDAPVLLPGESNFSVDPGFVQPERGDYRLRADSPLIDEGSSGVVAFGVDRDLDPRLLDGDDSGLPRVDLGADEYNKVALALVGNLVPGELVTLHVLAPVGWAWEVYGALGTNDSLLSATAGNVLLDPSTTFCMTCGLPPGTPLPVPSVPELAGLELYFQAYAFDPASNASRLSNRLDLTLP